MSNRRSKRFVIKNKTRDEISKTECKQDISLCNFIISNVSFVAGKDNIVKTHWTQNEHYKMDSFLGT